jgi:acetolactate synthase-1/2/3 large subunit
MDESGMKGAELFVKCLENEGVEYVFGLPGEEISEVLEALASSTKIKFILSRHEQAASFMADVYGRLTGRAGVCLSTLGPGATNLLTGVADAFLDRAPLVAITGQGGLERTYEESHQYIDVVSVYKFVTKWNRSITRAEFIPQVVRKAFALAESEKTGAVHIELPEDVASEEVSQRNLTPLRRETDQMPPVVNIEGARKALQLIGDAKMALILAGNGVIRANAFEELRAFAEEFNIPVVNTFMGKGAISSRDNLYLGTIGLQTRDLVNCAFEKSDLVITVGYDFVEYAPKLWNDRRKGERIIVHIDSSYSETDVYYPTALELVGNIRETLELLVTEARRSDATSRRNTKKDCSYGLKLRSLISEEFSKYSTDDSYPLKPQRIIHEIRKVLSDGRDILVSDVGMHKLWIARLYPTYFPNTVIISNGFASMGISLPGAIAAKLAKPKAKVIAACGDGGFLMSVYDLETARRLNISFGVVIFNDGQYSQIEWKQRAKFGESFFVSFNNPDFVKLAESFGCKGMRISKAEELSETLTVGFQSGETFVIDVPVDVKENLLLSDRLGDKVVCP